MNRSSHSSAQSWLAANATHLEQIHREMGQAFLNDLQGTLKQPLRLENMCLHLDHDGNGHLDERQRPFVACATSWGMQGNVAWICPAVTAAYLLHTLLGGGRYLPPPLMRPFTDIENGLLHRVADMLWKQVQTGWSTFTAMQLEPARHSGAALPITTSPVATPRMVVEWCLASPHARTKMYLAYACADVQQFFRQRSAGLASPYDPSERRSADPQCEPTKPAARDAHVRLEWAHASLPRHDVQGLHVGDILTTDASADSPVRIFVDGSVECIGRLVRASGALTVHIDSVPGGTVPGMRPLAQND